MLRPLFHPFTHLPIYPFTILIALLCIAGCSGKKNAYPPASSTHEAPQQRLEFVNAFLQGRWCEAARKFEATQDSYLRSDEVCQAARNYVLAWKLKSYVQINEPALLEKARHYRALGFGCPHDPPIPENAATAGTEGRDGRLAGLLASRDFAALRKALDAEEDPIFGSVYGRKGAAAAMAGGRKDLASAFVEKAREIDSRHGWLVLLREDWRMLRALADAPDTQRLIDERISLLEERIQPCAP